MSQATSPDAPLTIDIRSVISGKNPGLLRVLPAVLIRYLERIVHVRELNTVFRRLHGLTGLDFVRGALECLGVRVTTRGEQNLFLARKPLVVANHPLGGLDGLALMHAVGERLGEIRLPANDLLMNLPQLSELFVPVNKHGSNAANRLQFEGAFSSTKPIVHFPAGLCSRKRAGSVRDLEWQKSFVVRARRYQRDIVPVHVDGKNSTFFYGLARLRRWSGINFNVEMLYLVDEMFKQEGQTLALTFGRPIPCEVLDRRYPDWKWASMIRRHVYALAANPEISFGAPAGPGPSAESGAPAGAGGQFDSGEGRDGGEP